MTGIPEYGTGRHEDYLSQQEERAEVARDLAAEEVTREFAGWAAAQGYDDSEMYSFAEMDEAFAAGMQAARDLDGQDPSWRAELVAKVHVLRGTIALRDAEIGRLLASLAAACAHRDQLAAALGRIEARTDGAAPGTTASDTHEIAATALALRAGQATGQASAFTEWALFHGGEHPDDCAGVLAYDDEADCEEHLQWYDGAGIAKRTVSRGPWAVTRPSRPELALGEDPDDNLTDAQRAEYLRWRAEKGLRP